MAAGLQPQVAEVSGEDASRAGRALLPLLQAPGEQVRAAAGGEGERVRGRLQGERPRAPRQPGGHVTRIPLGRICGAESRAEALNRLAARVRAPLS